MKKIFLSLFAVIILVSNLNATVWRLNNSGVGANNGWSADFTGTLQAAINAVSSGDTIYVEPTDISYGDATITKQVHLIGAGYWLWENDSTQYYKVVSRVGKLIFNPGSAGSKVSGLYIYYGDFNSQQYWKLIHINTDSITIERNYIYGYVNNANTYLGYTIYLEGDLLEILIKQNCIYTNIIDSHSGIGTSTGTVYGIYSNGATTQQISIKNNFIRSYKSADYGIAKAVSISHSLSSNITMINNVISGNIYCFGGYFANNILITGSISGANNLFNSNIGNGEQFLLTNNNQQNVIMDSVFVDYTTYIDNGYLLKPNSPAIGAGTYGDDCGMFGALTTGTPYKLSGLPDIPAIFELTGDAITDSIPLQINIKAKSNN